MCHVRGRRIAGQYADLRKKKDFCLVFVCIHEDSLLVMYCLWVFCGFFFPVLGAKVFLVQGHVNDMSYLKNVFQSTSREI